MKQPPKHTAVILSVGLAFGAYQLLVDPEFALSTYRLLAACTRCIVDLDRLLIQLYSVPDRRRHRFHHRHSVPHYAYCFHTPGTALYPRGAPL